MSSDRRDATIYPIELLAKTWGMNADEQAVYFQSLLRSIGVFGYYNERDQPGIHAKPSSVRRVCGIRSDRSAKKALAKLVDDGLLVIEDGWAVPNGLPWDGMYKRARPSVSPALRREIFERDGRVCSYCASGAGPFDIDHVIPVCRGGASSAENLCVACATCNRSKGGRLLQEWFDLLGSRRNLAHG